jgi:hypothetical protein
MKGMGKAKVKGKAEAKGKPRKKTAPARTAARRHPIAKLIEARGGVAQFARDLSRVSGEDITWSRVNNWKIRNTLPKTMVVYVHQLTGAPLKDLLR